MRLIEDCRPGAQEFCSENGPFSLLWVNAAFMMSQFEPNRPRILRIATNLG
jgi:hypothetical protein